MSNYKAEATGLVKYRLERSRETLEAARIIADASKWNACMNRLCYVCFYPVSGLLQQQDLASSKHTGVRSLFNKNFVKTGRVSKTIAQIYNDFFDWLQEGDYSDFVRFEDSQVRPWIPRLRGLSPTLNLS